MYNIYTIGQQIMLADISSRMSLMISARPIPHTYTVVRLNISFSILIYSCCIPFVKPSSQLSLDGFFYFK